MSPCPHHNFNVVAEVFRIHKSEADPTVIVAYTTDIRVNCRDCGQPFEFIGLPLGSSFYQPTVSIDGQTLRAPIAIPGTMPPEGLAGFRVSQVPVEAKDPTKQ